MPKRDSEEMNLVHTTIHQNSAQLLQQLHSKYEQRETFPITDGENIWDAIVYYCTQTKKVSDVFLINQKTHKIDANLFTTGSFGDNFTTMQCDGPVREIFDTQSKTYGVQCNPKVENFVFGNLKLAEHMHFIHELHADSLVEIYNPQNFANESKMLATEYLSKIVNKIMNNILKMYSEELERPGKGKKIRYNETDPVVSCCLQYKKHLESNPYSNDFIQLKEQYLHFCGELMRRLPAAHQVVAKMGIGRGIDFSSIVRIMTPESTCLQTAAALIRFFFGTQRAEFLDLVLFLMSGTTQEYSFDDEKWATRVNEEDVSNGSVCGSLGYFDQQSGSYSPELCLRAIRARDQRKCLKESNEIAKAILTHVIRHLGANGTLPSIEKALKCGDLETLIQNEWIRFISEYLNNDIIQLSHRPWTHEQIQLLKLVIDGRVTWYDINHVLYDSAIASRRRIYKDT